MNVCERVSMFDGFAPPYHLEQWVNYSPHPAGGQFSDRHPFELLLEAGGMF